MNRVYIYGDSHADHSFRGLENSVNRYENSITMHRIGRDGSIINFSPRDLEDGDIFLFAYGEVDCRCHIGRQILQGRPEQEVINSLARSYLDTIRNTIPTTKRVVIVGVIPPTCQSDYETLHGPICHEFPFVGTDDERVRYTNKLNRCLEDLCGGYGYTYLYPYDAYVDDRGCLVRSMSDTIVHVGPNDRVLENTRIALSG